MENILLNLYVQREWRKKRARKKQQQQQQHKKREEKNYYMRYSGHASSCERWRFSSSHCSFPAQCTNNLKGFRFRFFIFCFVVFPSRSRFVPVVTITSVGILHARVEQEHAENMVNAHKVQRITAFNAETTEHWKASEKKRNEHNKCITISTCGAPPKDTKNEKQKLWIKQCTHTVFFSVVVGVIGIVIVQHAFALYLPEVIAISLFFSLL